MEDSSELNGQQLLRWMECDLGIDSRKLPACEEVQRVLGDEKHSKVLKVLRERLVSRKTARQAALVRELKRNETEQNDSDDPHKSELLHRRLEHLKWAAELKTSLKHADKELHEMQQRIEEKDLRHRDAKRRCEQRRLQLTLLRVYHAKMKRQIASLKEYASACKGQLNAARVNNPTSVITSSPSKAFGADFECSRDAQDLLSALVNEMHMQEADSFEIDQAWLAQAHASGIATRQLVVASAKLTQKSESTLQSEQASITITAESDPDVSAALAEVAARTEEAQKLHVRRFEEGEELRQLSCSARARLDQTVATVEGLLAAAGEEEGDRRIRGMGWKQDRDLAAAQAGLAAMAARIEAAKGKLQEKQREAEETRGEEAKAAAAAARVEEARARLGEVVAEVCRQREGASTQQRELRALSSQHAAAAPALASACRATVQALAPLRIQASSGDQLDDGPRDPARVLPEASAESIAPALPAAAGPAALPVRVLRLLGAPRFLGADHAARAAARAWRDAEARGGEVTRGLESLRRLRGERGFQGEHNAEARARAEEAVAGWEGRWRRAVEAELRPCLQTCQDAVERSGKIEALVGDWQQQPGQYAAPWVTVQGRTLRQWMDALQSTTVTEARTLP